MLYKKKEMGLFKVVQKSALRFAVLTILHEIEMKKFPRRCLINIESLYPHTKYINTQCSCLEK